jgi:dihydrofolate reductase
MRVSAIAAIDRSGVIGKGGRMPWHLPRDLKRFRTLTWGKPVVMGRNTFLSLDAPLAGRLNIVLTSQRGEFALAPAPAPGCTVVPSLEAALAVAAEYLKTTGGDETMIIGGRRVFEESLARSDRVYLTVVEGDFQGDTFFPLDALRQFRWRLVDRESWAVDSRNPYPHQFFVLERQAAGDPPAQDFDLSSWPAQPDADPCRREPT